MKKQKHIRNLINKAVDIVFWSCIMVYATSVLVLFFQNTQRFHGAGIDNR